MKKVLAIVHCMFLIAGTCIGGGMLALPVLCGQIGPFPSAIVLLTCAFFMFLTGYYYAEVSMWFKKQTNILSMANHFLGPIGKNFCGLIFLFIGFASLAAYISCGGRILCDHSGFSFPKADIFGPGLYSFVLLGLLYFRLATSINSLLFFGLIVSYFVILILGLPSVDFNLFQYNNWDPSSIVSTIPIMITSFSFPGIIPMIADKLDREVVSIRLALVGGIIITACIYLLWMTLVLGIVPLSGDHGLFQSLSTDQSVTSALIFHTQKPVLAKIILLFSFFAITTSYLGVALSLCHFFMDAFQLKREKGKKWIMICLIVVLFPLVIKINFAKIFYNALEYSGGIGDALISGILPTLMVFLGRRKLKKIWVGTWGAIPVLLVSLAFFGGLLSYEFLK